MASKGQGNALAATLMCGHVDEARLRFSGCYLVV